MVVVNSLRRVPGVCIWELSFYVSGVACIAIDLFILGLFVLLTLLVLTAEV